MQTPALALSLLILFSTSPTGVLADSAVSTTQNASLFDPQRHMRVSEVRPGMKGYGLSVFYGSKIDRFEVEVISILHNFNPKYDAVLIRCSGQNLEHTGSIAGMSGSPIYLYDDAGKARMIGAFAYGWGLVKDPIAGVQPIEYMLDIGSTLRPDAAATQQTRGLAHTTPHEKGNQYFVINPRRTAIDLQTLSPRSARLSGLTTSFQQQMQPLATPLMVGGISARTLETLAPYFDAAHLVPLQAGGGGGAAPTTQRIEIEPGSVVAAPMLTGDVDLTALGTCTEVIGERVFAFGHPFNNEGPITLPLAAGVVNAVIPKVDQSFKLGAMAGLRGTLIADQVVGVSGRLGKAPPTIPIDLRVVYADGSLDQRYHFQAAAHPRLTPMLAGVALTSALSGQRDLPQYHTVHYALDLQFANHPTIHLDDVVVNVAPTLLTETLFKVIELAAENPYERAMLSGVSGTLSVESEAHEADVLSVGLPKLKYRGGDILKANVRYRPFRTAEKILPIELELPRDLADGTYQLSVSDLDTYLQAVMVSQPFRFTSESIDDVFSVVKDFSGLRSDALYVRFDRQSDGVALGRVALPSLPSSRRQVLLGAGRSNVTPFVTAVEKIVPTEMVMNGSADFEIEIDNQDQVEVNGKISKPEPRNAGAPGIPAAPSAAKAAPALSADPADSKGD